MLTSHELFGFMSPALANDILTFTFETDKPITKPAERRRRGAPRPPGFSGTPAACPAPCPDDCLAGAPGPGNSRWRAHPRLAREKERTMLVDFLNALGIPNNEGVVDDCRRRWRTRN